MQHFNIINENQTIYDSLAFINNNFQTLLTSNSGSAAPKSDSNTPIAAGTVWYNSSENKVYQLGNASAKDWRLVADLNGTGTTKEYVDSRILGHNHNNLYLKLNSPAIDVVSVNGKPANTVIFQSNISDKSGTNSPTVAPSSRLFEVMRKRVDTFINTLGDPDKILKQLKDILELIDNNKGTLNSLGINNINGLKAALASKMLKSTTLEDLGGVRADGKTPDGFTSRIVFTKTPLDAKGGQIAVAKKGGTPLIAVSIREGKSGKSDAVQLGDPSSATYIDAKDAESVYVSTSPTSNMRVWNEGNMSALKAALISQGFPLKSIIDSNFLPITGKAADAAKLGGAVASTSDAASTIVKRDSNQGITAKRLTLTGSVGTVKDAKYILAQPALGQVKNNYARPISIAGIKAAMGLSKTTPWSSNDLDNRFFNISGDTVTGKAIFKAEFKAMNFEIFPLPAVNMGSNGINDEYLILMPAHTANTTAASAISGRFQFQRGNAVDSNVFASCGIILSSAHDASRLRMFDADGEDIFTSIDEIEYAGKRYYAARCRSNGGGATHLWEFHGTVLNEEHDKNIFKVVRLSASNVKFVKKKWSPADPINTFNYQTHMNLSYLRLDGTTSMTGDLKLKSKKNIVFSGEGAIRLQGGKVILHADNNATYLSSGSLGNPLVLGANNNGAHLSELILLETDVYSKGRKNRIIDATNARVYDSGYRVYSPSNKGEIAFKDQIESIQNLWKFDFGLESHSDIVIGSNTSKHDAMKVGWDVSGRNARFRMTPMGRNGKFDIGKEFGYDDATQKWYFDEDIVIKSGKVWHARNHGSGSGMDADKVDGLQAAQFLRSDTNDVATGNINFKGNIVHEKTVTHLGQGMTDVSYFIKLSAKKSSLAKIVSSTGGNLNSNAVYELTIGCPGTGTMVSTRAYLWNDGVWRVTNYNSGSRSSNYAWVVISKGLPYLATGHSNPYIYSIVMREIRGVTASNKSKPHIFGANGLFSSDATNVYVNGSQGEVGRGKLWHSANDGSGSGLDADMVDGIQGSNIVTLSAKQKITATKTFAASIDLANNVPLRVDFTDNAGKYRDSGEVIKATKGINGTLEVGTNKAALRLFSKSNPSVHVGSHNFTLWHSGNDGAGSGLDADKLDGLSSANYMRENGWDKAPGVNADSQANMSCDFSYKNKCPHTGPLVNMGVNHYYLQFNSEYGRTALAVRTKNGDNKKWNPWATVWTSASDGAGSGLDADKLDGFQTSSSSYSGNTIPVRNSSGDITARLFRSNYTNEASLRGAIAFRVSTSDNYIRFCSSPASVRAWLGVPAKSEALPARGKAADADKLDGINSSSFLRSDANDSFSGDMVSTSRSKGIFGIYDSKKVDQIWSMGTAYRVHSSGANFGKLYGLAYKHVNNPSGGTMAGSHQMVWCENGSPRVAIGQNVWTSGNVTAYSDIRVKKDLKRIENALEKLSKITGYTYNRTDIGEDESSPMHNPENRFAGVIAQEVVEVLPEVVTGGPTQADPNNHYSVAYGNLTALLIEAIKELKYEVEELKSTRYSLH